MKIVQVGHYDSLLFMGLVFIGFSAWQFRSGGYKGLLLFIGLAVSLLLFIISWVTLSFFTRDILDSAVTSARTAVVYFGMVVVTAILVELSLSRFLWPVAFFTEIVVVCVGMSYLHFLNRRKGVVTGLIISVAVFASILIFRYTVI